MEESGTVKYKSRKFAINIIGVYKKLVLEKKEFVLARQILRSGTSVGANLAEAEYAISKREFLAKEYIALKECAETKYWLDLLHETNFLEADDYQRLITMAEEIRRMLQSSTRTLRSQLVHSPSTLHPAPKAHHLNKSTRKL
jgi:four helix bundle protein